jgi:phosphatidyl-myo-inositol alpha-mannosyltransferase
LRVAVVCPYDIGRPGGVQQLTFELVTRLAEAGHDTWLVGPGDPPSGQPWEFRSVGTTVTIRANASRAPVALGPSVPRRVRLAVEGADVIHVHEPLMPLASLTALRLSLPRVVTFHADVPRWVGMLYRSGGRIVDGAMRASVVTAVSAVAASAIPPRWGPVEVIPNGLTVSFYRPAGAVRAPQRVTFLGRDDPRKGLEVLLEAWPAVRDAVPGAELVVMGSKRPLGVPGVRFAGRVSEAEKRSLLSTAAVHVAPNTRGESFGIVVAEAMAGGAAVVASDLAAFRAVLGDCGSFVPVGDSEALSATIIRLLADPVAARRLSECGRARVKAFDWDTVVPRWIEAYGRAAERSG